jgi:hypothetical protein
MFPRARRIEEGIMKKNTGHWNIISRRFQMKTINRGFVLALLLTSLLLSACGSRGIPVTGGEKPKPAHLEPIEGSDLQRVLLTEKAAQRIDLQTAPVTSRLVNGSSRDVVPYAAVIYDTEGNTWVYTNPEPLVFVRAPIEVDHIEGDEAILANRWNSRAHVVTVGVAELYGTETGVSK